MYFLEQNKFYNIFLELLREKNWVGDNWLWNTSDYFLEYSDLINKIHISNFNPQIFFFLSILTILLVSMFLRLKGHVNSKSLFLNLVTIFLFICLFINLFFNYEIIYRPILLFHRGLLLNYYTVTLSSYILLFSLLFLVTSLKYFFSRKNKINGFIEYPVLLGFSIYFLLALVSSYDLMVSYLTLEGLSILLYVLAAYPFKQSSLEASIKYYSLGALSSGILLFGISLIYGLTGSFDFLNIKFFFTYNFNIPYIVLNFTILCLIFGFLFKISAFPCHMWAPDVYEGTWLPTTVFFMVIIKLGVFFFFIRLIVYLFFSIFSICQTILMISALGSIIVGSFGSLYQHGIKKILSYTSISQVGFALIGIACGTPAGITSTILFFCAYIVASMGVFIILINAEGYYGGNSLVFISDLTNFNKYNKIESLVLTILILSMAGIPPLAGFYGKLTIFLATIGAHLYIFTIIILILSTINAYIYIRIIKILWSDHIVLVNTDNVIIYDIFVMFLSNFLKTKHTDIIIYEKIIKYSLRVLLLYITTMQIFLVTHLSWCRSLMYSMILINPNIGIL